MVEYNPKEWFVFLFRITKADTLRKLMPMMVCLAIYGALVILALDGYLHVEGKQWDNFSSVYSMLGFVISLLFVFRTNTAYERWWEGRRQWGALVNVSRSFAQKLVAANISEQDKKDFAALIPNFAFALKNHLRTTYIPGEKQENSLLPVMDVNEQAHVPNQILGAMHGRVNELLAEGGLKEMQFLSVQTELNAMYDILGACERIRNTPIPYSYSSFLKKFIFLYIMIFPLAFLKPMGYFLVPAVVFIFYVLASLEILAEEIEDPFGTDANDLPTDKISENIRKSVSEIFFKFKR